VPDLTDNELRALLVEDPERGWRAFVDQYTPTLLGLIARAGIVDRDDAGDVYVRVCERLAADRCARLRQRDPRRGALAAWLTIVVRHTAVDWVRSRAGRRRLFGVIRELPPVDRRVFELRYWEHRDAAEVVELLRGEGHGAIGLANVLQSLHRIHEAMTDRHRAELLSLAARRLAPASLDEMSAEPASDVPAADPEHRLRARELNAHFVSALEALPVEDAAIVRLTFVQGWSRGRVQRALHLDQLGPERITSILDRLRALLAERGLGPADAGTPGLMFLEGGSR
jgi:DNA-directed RNA polymerase specialized sigma24 family protein